jgi:hypothetical protein
MAHKSKNLWASGNLAKGNDAIKEEAESLAWCVAKIPTCDLDGHQFKAALFALLEDLELGEISCQCSGSGSSQSHSRFGAQHALVATPTFARKVRVESYPASSATSF